MARPGVRPPEPAAVAAGAVARRAVATAAAAAGVVLLAEPLVVVVRLRRWGRNARFTLQLQQGFPQSPKGPVCKDAVQGRRGEEEKRSEVEVRRKKIR